MENDSNKPQHKRIDVVKTYLPKLSEYNTYLEQIWGRNQVTNNGPLSLELEKKLAEFLKIDRLEYVTNGTVALQIAIHVLELKGEIITTPYSYVATTNSIIWENCTPVFVDIDPNTFGIDANKIRAKINNKTCAILATHVYGIPCDVDKIGEIARNSNLKVIYDAAHAFGVNVNGKSIYEYGTISTASFHATKIYHTIEGGGIVTTDPQLAEKVFLCKTFGHRMDVFHLAGINGKNSEFHAAIGLCNLKVVEEIIQMRKEIFEYYCNLLENMPIKTLKIDSNNDHNYAYFPAIFDNHERMMKVKKALETENIFARRYFYPSLNLLPYVSGEECPISESISARVLCLPFYHDLEKSNVERICQIIKLCY